MSELILVWHRRDLRSTDHTALAAARQRTANVVGVFCLDPDILQRDDIAPVRVTYLIGCLAALQKSYARAGSQLLILKAPPLQGIVGLATALKVEAVFWHKDVEPYSRSRDRAVAAALREQGIEVCSFWDQLLHAPGEVLTGSKPSPKTSGQPRQGNPYTVYTPFWKNWSKQAKAAPFPKFANAQGLSDRQQATATQAGAIPLPTAKDLGFHWENELFLEPGEHTAQDKLAEFCDQAITNYDEQRNFPAQPGTSQLSAALKFGAIGIRTVWAATVAAHDQTRSDEARTGIQTWQQELAWREFYQHALYFFPELADGPYRNPFHDFPWDNQDEHFQAWCQGRTGYPIVDAAMRQLNQTGWMHNRCRMIVASFLTKDLIIDWRWGEKYFMQRLIDGDLAANNGGWQWSASSGMDPKPLRIFNPATQAQKFDSEAEYIREWLPELRSVETKDLLTGHIEQPDRHNYPAPIVDHKQQQQQFKTRYQQQKKIYKA
jgi:deoxyribodipyrimidine photo-lyase